MPIDEPVLRLIHEVIRVCERTSDVAQLERRGPFALEPLRDSIDALLQAIEEVERTEPELPELGGLGGSLSDALGELEELEAAANELDDEPLPNEAL